MLAVLEAGAAYLPIEPRSGPPSAGPAAEQGEVGVVLTQPCVDAAGVARRDRAIVVDDGRRGRVAGRAARVTTPGRPGLRDLHVRFDRRAQGRDDRPPRARSTPSLDINARFGVGPDDRVLGAVAR